MLIGEGLGIKDFLLLLEESYLGDYFELFYELDDLLLFYEVYVLSDYYIFLF